MKNYVKGRELFHYERYQDIRALLKDQVRLNPNGEAYLFKEGSERTDVTKTYTEFYHDINALGEALLAREIIQLGRGSEPEALVDGRNPYRTVDGGPIRRPLEALAVIGDNCYKWMISYLSFLFGLGVAVPLDRDLQTEEALGLAQRASITTLAFTASHRKVAEHLAENCSSVHSLIALDESEERVLNFNSEEGEREVKVLSLPLLLAEGEALLAGGSKRYESLEIHEYDLAAIFFTSGTTAQAKGVMLSHFNMASDLWGGQSIIHIKATRRNLSVLPLHHTFENIVGQMALWQRGMTICFNDKLRYLAQNLKDWEIDSIFMVPLILESIHRRMRATITKQGKAKLVKRLIKFSNVLRKVGIDLRGPLFKQLRSAVAPNLISIFMGGAPLNPELQEFFNDLGYDVWNAYGLTEAAPGITAGNLETSPIGSVGRVCADDEMRIEVETVDEAGNEIGQVVVKSDSIMLGYYRDPEATAKVIDADGWLHTGDLGYLKDECLFLSGRAKSMIVLENGKNIFPEELENMLKESIPEVQDAMVWPEQNRRGLVELAVRIQLDKEIMRHAAPEEQAQIAKKLAELIAQQNKRTPSYKAIKHYFWSTEPMVVTTTRKVKRREELKRIYASLAAKGLTVIEAEPQELELGQL
ncbi:MAG: AMP-binding protein [Eubacteriales bacterium]|nr:AMP-binding protein [Eubacteriales bacterium]